MSDRSETLAAEFERTNAAFVETVEGLTDGQWGQVCADEGWSVGVVAHHIASSTQPVAGLVGLIANGQPTPPITREMIDAMNAKHAEEHASCTRDEVLSLLRTDGAATAAMLRSFSDEQLDRTAPMAFAGGAPMSAQQVAEIILIGHSQDHLKSIRSAVA